VGASSARPGGMETGFDDARQGGNSGLWRQNDPTGGGQDQGTNAGQRQARWFRAGLDITA